MDFLRAYWTQAFGILILISRECTFYKHFDSQSMRRKECIRDRQAASVDEEISSQFWCSKKDTVISKYVKVGCQINYTYASLGRRVLICKRTANKKDSPQLSMLSAPYVYRWTREPTTWVSIGDQEATFWTADGYTSNEIPSAPGMPFLGESKSCLGCSESGWYGGSVGTAGT